MAQIRARRHKTEFPASSAPSISSVLCAVLLGEHLFHLWVPLPLPVLLVASSAHLWLQLLLVAYTSS